MPPPSISIPGSQPDHPTGSTTGTSSTTSAVRSEEHTSELQSQSNLVCRLLLEKTTHSRPTATDRRRTRVSRHPQGPHSSVDAGHHYVPALQIRVSPAGRHPDRLGQHRPRPAPK